MIKKKTEKFLAQMSQTLDTISLRGGSTYSKLSNPLIYTKNKTSLQSYIAMNKQDTANLSCQKRLLTSPFNNLRLQWGFIFCMEPKS